MERRGRDPEECMFCRKVVETRLSFWLPTSQLPSPSANSFYQKLDQALTASGFVDTVRALCEPFY